MGYHLGGRQLAGEQVRSAPGKAMRLKVTAVGPGGGTAYPGPTGT